MFNKNKKQVVPPDTPKTITNLHATRESIEKVDFKPATKDKMAQNQVDFMRKFVQVFDNQNGQMVLEHLDKYSHKNFPNYDNVNATYSKIGEQTLVAYIRSILHTARKGGE